MASGQWTTVADELIEHAENARGHFRNCGYTVTQEAAELGFPFTPTLLCKRHRTTLICEVGTHSVLSRISLWLAYGRSSGKDTRVAVVCAESEILSTAEEDSLRTAGVGLYRSRADATVVEVIGPQDLALNVSLPPLAQYPRKVRVLLGQAYDQFRDGDWREGFESACQALEDEARRYLKAAIRIGRVTILSPAGVPQNPSQRRIDKMTMGQLAHEFDRIQSPNHADVILGKALGKINSDRVGVAHHKTKQRTEKRLRSNVGHHMWSIVAALNEICG